MLVAWGLYVILIIALGWLSPLLGLAVLLIFGLMIIAIPWWSTVVNGARQMKDKQLRDRMYAELTDDVLGLADWRLAGRRADYLKRHAATEKLAMNNRLAEHRFARRRDFLMEMLFLLMAVSLVLWGPRVGDSIMAVPRIGLPRWSWRCFHWLMRCRRCRLRLRKPICMASRCAA